MARNPPLCSFASFLIVLLTTDSSRELSIFMVSSMSSFKVINAVMPEPKIFFLIDATVNRNGTKMLLANSWSTFYIKGKPVLYNNDSKILPGNLPDYLILENWAFDNFILAEELAAKALRSL